MKKKERNTEDEKREGTRERERERYEAFASESPFRSRKNTLHLCVTQRAPLARWFAAVTRAASCATAVKSDSGFISCFEF